MSAPRMGGKYIRYRRPKIEMTVDVSSETMQVRRQWSLTAKMLQGGKNTCQIRILYPVKITSKNKEKYCCRHTKAKRIHHKQTCTIKNVEEVIQVEGK